MWHAVCGWVRGVSMWSGEGADCGTILSWRKYFEKICHTSVANVSFDEIL